MQNDTQNNPAPTSSDEAEHLTKSLKIWVAPILCTLITTVGAIYTTYSNHVTLSEVEAFKAKSEEQVTKIKSDTEYQIKQAELRAQENIIRLTNQLEAEKDERAKITATESAALTLRTKKCSEIKEIRDEMSSMISHVRRMDPLLQDALTSLQTAAHKSSSYLSNDGLRAYTAAMPEQKSSDFFQGRYDYYLAILEGYNAELRMGCRN